MITIQPLQADQWEQYRAVRLAALRDSPAAFCATFDEAQRRPPESWMDQVERLTSGVGQISFFAYDGPQPVGMASLYAAAHDPHCGEIMQVWVAPDHRGGPAAGQLLAAIAGWAENQGMHLLALKVKRDNGRAIRFYEKLGFTRVESRDTDQELFMERTVLLGGVTGVSPVQGVAQARGKPQASPG